MKRFFSILVIAMIVLLGVAVVVFINRFQPMGGPASKPQLNASGSPSKGGLPADYYDLVKSARDDEGQACDAASNAFGAADNANREAKTAEDADDVVAYERYRVVRPDRQGIPGKAEVNGPGRAGRPGAKPSFPVFIGRFG